MQYVHRSLQQHVPPHRHGGRRRGHRSSRDPFWRGDMDIGGDANDQRISNVYGSIAGVWFLEQKYDRILDLLCLIIDIQCAELDSPRLPEVLRGSESIVWGGPTPASLFAFPEVCRGAGGSTAMAMVQASRVLEQRLVERYRGDDCRRGAGIEIEYKQRGQRGGVTRAPSSRVITAAGIPQGVPVLPILQALLPPFPRSRGSPWTNRGISQLARHARKTQ